MYGLDHSSSGMATSSTSSAEDSESQQHNPSPRHLPASSLHTDINENAIRNNGNNYHNPFILTDQKRRQEHEYEHEEDEEEEATISDYTPKVTNSARKDSLVTKP